ncbi:MAG: glyoxalase [Myxococcaceae bacterium]|nr:glyoxalase [Myxococcaceae bacterium]
MEIVHISGMALITTDGRKTRDLLTKVIGLDLKPPSPEDEYVFSDTIPGSRHFGVWPLSQAAQACFGTAEWPKDRRVPQLTLELEVKSPAAVTDAEQELRAKGHELIHATRTEPWGQTVCRLLTAEGVILGISFAPWQH